MPFRIVCIGDSIVWGQALLPNEKFNFLVQQALLPKFPGATLESVAHSGAVIGATGVSGTPQVGEVPASRLSIIEQCDGYTNFPETVDLVLMDGGINDVGVIDPQSPRSHPLTRHEGCSCLSRRDAGTAQKGDREILQAHL